MNSTFEEQEYTGRFSLEVWKGLLTFGRSYRRHIIGLVIVMAVVGITDTVFPLFSRYAVDNFITTGRTDGIGTFAALFGLTVLVQGINIWILIALAGKIDMGMCHDIRKKAFARLQELSFSYYDKTPTGWIMARLTSDTGKLGDVFAWGIVDLVWGTTMMLFSVGVMLWMHWQLALVTMTVIPVLVAVSWFFQQRILATHRAVRKVNSRITGSFNEGIMGARTTKTLVREDENLDEFRTETTEMYTQSVRAAVFSSLYLPVVLALSSVGTALALWYGGARVAIGGLSYGTLVAFMSYMVQFFMPVRELARIFAELQSAQASGERVLSLINTEPEITDNAVRPADDGKEPPEVKGRIEFDNVSFKYDKGERVLKDFSLTVNAGERIALVGETGSGKTTIANLACRFYEPTEGTIRIDGTDYRQRPLEWLHSSLGYVLQTPHLFSGTVRENIRYGNLEATEAQVERAAKTVHAHSFINELADGYDTEVGEGGNRLSTGQKQLVSLARAVLADPRLFVLDEATSSVDTETEQLIQDAVEKVLAGRTSFVIAHRLSTIRSADRILVLEKGRVIEEGTHHELLGKKGHYATLYTNQFVEEARNRMLN